MTDVAPAPDGYPIKLVRDGTAAKINSSGEPGELFYRKFPRTLDLREWLQRKLGEEVTEYLIEGSFKELLDVLAVVEALVLEHGRSMEYALATLRTHPRGGFTEGIMMYGRHKEYDNA